MEEVQEVGTRGVWKKRVVAVAIGVGIAALSFLGGFFTKQWTQDEELQVLTEMKNMIQQEYYQTVTDEQFYDAAIKGVNEYLLDPYSKYMNRAETIEATAHGKGKYEGVGLAFLSSATGEQALRIQRVSGNSPAENAGVVAGSYVVGIGGLDEEMQPVDEYQAFIDALATYETDEAFYVYTRTQRNALETERYRVTKSAYVENYVYYRDKTSSYRFSGKEDATASAWGTGIDALPEDTAYIRLVQFNGNAGLGFDSAMDIFKQANKTNLVLDLRGNGGGYLSIMQDISKYFCKNTTEKTPVAAYAEYEDSREEYRATGNVYDEYFKENSQIYVLADSSSASASECLLGVMLDYGATTYGNICLSKRGGEAKTFGKGIMQVTFTLSIFRGDSLKLTTAKILWPSTNCIHGRGILLEDGTKTVEENAFGDTEIIDALQQFGI